MSTKIWWKSKAPGRGSRNSHPGLPKARIGPKSGRYSTTVEQLIPYDPDDPDEDDDTDSNSSSSSSSDEEYEEDGEWEEEEGEGKDEEEEEEVEEEAEEEGDDENDEERGEENDEDFMKSVRTQIDELANAGGFKTDLIFVKPPGYNLYPGGLGFESYQYKDR